MNINRKILALLYLSCNLYVISNANAVIINAKSCSQSDVQAAIDSAGDGDIVVVPAGNAAWNSTVSFPSDKSLAIMGAGINETNIIINTTAFYQNCNKKPVRITGFSFTGFANPVIHISGTCTDFRVDHNKFEEIVTRAIHIDAFRGYEGPIYGVIDHNLFTGKFIFAAILISGHNDESWSEPLSLGSGNAVYIEDNTFDFSSATRDEGHVAVDCNMGGRFVFRYNTLHNIAIANHGVCANPEGHRGCHSWEFYKNKFIFGYDGSDWYRIYNLRSGTGVIYDEQINTVNGIVISLPIGFMNYRTCLGEGTTCNDYWDRCDGNSIHDGNLDSTGYPCLDQIGRTSDMDYDGIQDLAAVYEWNNTLDGNDIDIALHHISTCDSPSFYDHIKENRDYYNDTQKPGYTPYTYPHPLTQIDSPKKLRFIKD